MNGYYFYSPFRLTKTEIPMNRYYLIIISLLSVTSTFAQVDSADYFFQKGLKEKELGRKLEVWKNMDKAYHYAPDNTQVVSELAAILLDLRKYGQAKEMYQKLESLGITSADNYRQLMTLSFNMKQHDDVIHYATKLKQVDKTAKVSYMMGKSYYNQENYGDGIKHLEAAQKEEPDNAEIPYLIGRSYADMFNYKQSLPYYIKAITLNPAKSDWTYELGMIYYAMGDNANSLKYMLLAREKGYKKSNDYQYNLGIAYLNTGNLTEGLKIFTELLKKRPSDLNILNIVAESYYFAGKYQEAMDYWDKMLEYDMKNASALYMIGMCYQKKGEKDKGVALCDKAIEMDPSLANLKQKKQMMGM